MNKAVLFLVFNRPELTRRVMAAIREARPRRLYVAADGPRADKHEDELCRQTRQIATEVDWPCEVKTLFRAHNLGCRRAVGEAIDWLFQNEESGIILEDDCCPHPTFFPYCEELLDRYAMDERIMCVDGSSFVEPTHRLKESYCFSQYVLTWGWATWRRAWALYDAEMSQWPNLRETQFLRARSEGDSGFESYWTDVFDWSSKGTSWDGQWLFSCWLNHGVSCHPARNLVSNIGFCADGTHLFDPNHIAANRPAVPMEFPLIHPEHRARDVLVDRQIMRMCFGQPEPKKPAYRSVPGRAVSRVKRVFRRLATALDPIGKKGERLPQGCRPVSRVFGFDRGQPVDRYYIERFLQLNRAEIKGRVLEIGDAQYTNMFGAGQVTHSDILHVSEGNAQATLVGDLATGAGIPAAVFDCMILTQTLPFIFDIQGAVVQIHKALKPGGVALLTMPGISQISRYDMERWGDYWRFTDASARRLFGDVFGTENITIFTYGNALTACSFLQGLAAHELKLDALDFHDPDYQVTIGVRATRPMEQRI